MASRSFGSEAPRLGHLVTGKGGVAGEVDDLRGDVDDGFESIEAEIDIIGLRRPVKLATAAALNACTAAGSGAGKTLTQNAAAVENIDGVAVVVGDRILVKDQVAAKDNGIYTVTTVGTVAVKQVLTRATDADAAAQVKSGMLVWVSEGTANADKLFALTTSNTITVDTTALIFEQQTDIGLKKPVKLATAAALNACTAAGTGDGKTLTQNAAAVENIDGVALAVGDRILVKDQVAGKDNGIYVVTTVGTVAVPQVLTRATDADSDAQVKSGMLVWVSEGTANADNLFALTTSNPITVDTTALTFETKTNILHAATHIRGAADAIDGDLLDVDYTAANYTATVTAPATHAEHLTAHLSGIDLELVDVVQDEGCAASAVIIQAGLPVAAETLTVGADVYEADGVGALGFAIVGGDANATMANLLAAATGGSATENLFWEAKGATQILISNADAPQGTIIGGSPNIALTEAMTNYTFNCGNVNMNTLAGKAAGKKASCSTKLTVTAAMITATTIRVSFPFPVSVFTVSIFTSADALKMGGTDNFTIDGNDIVITVGAGGAPDIVATDVVHIVAYA